MFATENKEEYDPDIARSLERPLAGGRPLDGQFQHNSPTATNEDARRQLPSQMSASKNHAHEQATPRQLGSPTNNGVYSGSPGKNQTTPTKSSMSRAGRYSGRITPFDPASDIYSDGESGTVDDSQLDRSPNRHAKSVTFDAAPPQINEYEMTTPVPSSVASSSREGSQDSCGEDEDESFEHNSSMVDDSFDASLEDTDKTPVVLPEDWRFMNPDSANDGLLHGGDDDPFCEEDGSSDRDPTPDSVQQPQPLRPRLESMDSNGERRPLPPLPEPNPHDSPEHHTSAAVSAFEQTSSPNREYPSPLRPASCSKADIADFGNNSMSLEDRLRLMMTKDGENSPSEADKQRERRMRRAGARDKRAEREGGDNTLSPMSGGSERDMSPDMSSTPPRISRESILRDIKSEDMAANDTSNLSASARSPSPLPLDRDVPIPSLETEPESDDREVPIKEEMEHEIDLYDIPEYCPGSAGRLDSPDQASQGSAEDDDGSSYSREDEHAGYHQSPNRSTPVPQNHPAVYDERTANGRPGTASPVSNDEADQQFDAEFLNYGERSISPVEGSSTIAPHFNMASIRNSLYRPQTPEQKDGDAQQPDDDDDRDTPPTPQSVIRHPLTESPEPSGIPEPMATIKASSELKTKPSLTPADAETMAATRRKVSGQDEPTQPPPIQEYEREDESTFIAPGNKTDVEEDTLTAISMPQQEEQAPSVEQRQSSLVKLDIPVSSSDEGLGFGLDQEFDRVIEAEKVAFDLSLSQLSYPSSLNSTRRLPLPNGTSGTKDFTANPQLDPVQKNAANTFLTRQRGYMMRQNTKVIYASNRPNDEPAPPGAEGADNARRANEVEASPRKASQQTWTVEPWNGKPRRQSIKLPGTIPRKKVPDEPVPPLPGHESNAKDATGTEPRESVGSRIDEPEDGEERGRLFVKVVGAKNLDLPLPRSQCSLL